MTALMAVLLFFAPAGVDVPPEINWTATVDIPAVRVDPPAPPPVVEELPDVAPAGLSDCAEMSWYRQRAGLPARFDAIGRRESSCRNEESVHTSCCWGWFQLNVALHLRDHRLAGRYAACGVSSRFDVDSDTPGDKLRGACATRALFDVVGYSAWATTS